MAGRITHCRLCEGSLKRVHDFGKTALANEYPATATEALEQERFPLQLVQCEQCGHVQLDYVVDPERLFRNYAYTSGTTKSFRDHLKKLSRIIDGEYPGCSVLEIGSNDGTLLAQLDGKHKTLGVDPAANLAARNTLHEFWTEAFAKSLVKQKGRWDVIVALNVFAHVADIQDFVRGVYHALNNRGVFIFEVGHLNAMVERGHYDVIYHEHLDYHTVRALKPFLKRHGLALKKWWGIPCQGGSIRCMAIKASEGACPEEDAPLDLSAFAMHIQNHGKMLNKMVRSGAFDGGFGCPAKLTTLVHNAKLTAKDMPVIYDDNPHKIGRFTPGTGIPIKPTSEIPPNSKLLLFSWNFVDEIRRRFPTVTFEVPF